MASLLPPTRQLFRGGAARLGARWGAHSWEVWGGSPRPSTFHSPRIWPLPRAPSSGPLASLHSLYTAQGPQAPGQWCLFAARFQGREDVLCSLLQPEIFPRTRGWFGLPFAPGRSEGPARVQRFEERWEGLQGSCAEKASLRNWGAGGGRQHTCQGRTFGRCEGAGLWDDAQSWPTGG